MCRLPEPVEYRRQSLKKSSLVIWLACFDATSFFILHYVSCRNIRIYRTINAGYQISDNPEHIPLRASLLLNVITHIISATKYQVARGIILDSSIIMWLGVIITTCIAIILCINVFIHLQNTNTIKIKDDNAHDWMKHNHQKTVEVISYFTMHALWIVCLSRDHQHSKECH